MIITSRIESYEFFYLFLTDCYLQGQGHSEGLYKENMTVYAIPFELMVHL